MAPDVLAKVSEPLFTAKPKGKGTGLGLAMARGFAEQSGGALAIESAPGRGTTVSLWLPRAVAGARGPDPHCAHEDHSSAATGPSASLLVVDDEAGVRAVLSDALAERGHTVSQADSAASALEMIRADKPVDALVTDLAMPGGMDGLGLIREARRRRPGLPAVLVTGHVGDAVRGALEEAAGTGPFAVLCKPVSPEALEAQVGALLRGRTGPSSMEPRRDGGGNPGVRAPDRG
jgi:CheY-like chemotaxis protein